MKVFVLAGELSGDKLGGALLAGLHRLLPDLEVRGVGGPLMQAEGVSSLFPMDELSVMGIAEVLPKYLDLKKRLNQTAAAVLEWAPDVLITIDSPDFSLRLAKLVKARSSIKTIHYVAPSVWAWRPKRAEKMAAHIDHVLALLPFEPPLMKAAGMGCDFVGHPIVAEPIATDEEVRIFRQAEAIGDAPMLLVLPGSRRSEVARLSSVFGAAMEPVLAAHPDARIVVPAASAVAGLVKEAAGSWPGKPIVLDPSEGLDPVGRKRAAFRAADVALAASGTVSLELAANRTPMVVAYDMNWLTWQIMSRLAVIDTVTLVNLVSGEKAVPEFLGPACQAQDIGRALLPLLTNASARERQVAAMELTMDRLGRGGEPPGLRAAKAVIRVVDDRAS
ncbi:MAG: lipid-A-disaccharide synthase [Boseongicola sp.]|nr:lipid-A-disaccharide synthase [Boseongicola sp.]NNJ69499.1 lipid-A-disaccharide synthase [Boseongicola sp.]